MIERIEVYLDGATEPSTRLEGPPFRLELDTTTLPDGPHTLRIVTHANGGTSERQLAFQVQNQPAVHLAGLEDGAVVQGKLSLGFDGPAPVAPPATSNVPVWLYPLASVLVLGGVWAFFAFFMGSGSSVDPAVMTQGKAVYAANCAGCHNADGTGTPEYAPPLAGNPHLADAGHVLEAIIKGLKGGVEVAGKKYTAPMAALSQLSDADVAAVTTYVRNSWGNAFGSVSEADAKAKR